MTLCCALDPGSLEDDSLPAPSSAAAEPLPFALEDAPAPLARPRSITSVFGTATNLSCFFFGGSTDGALCRGAGWGGM